MLEYQTLRKLLFKLDPETAHLLAEIGMGFAGNFAPFLLTPIASKYLISNSLLEQDIFGVKFPNPVGVAAGLDKNAVMIRALSAVGFGYVEYGTMTPKPQDGNEKPRLFRHVEEESLQNAMGFNNDGAEKISKRLSKIYPYVTPLGANIGKNKATSQEEAIGDYEKLVEIFSPLCDYLVVNISSPNTPNLRDLQNEKFIKELFTTLTPLTNKPILLKIAPDMSDKNAIDICSAALENGAKGIVATNTSIDYSLLRNAKTFGGISGRAIEEKSFALFDAIAKEFYKYTTLISVGGISSAEDAYKRVCAGASLIQIFSSFIFQGPIINYNINTGLSKMLETDGFNNIKEAVGSRRK